MANDTPPTDGPDPSGTKPMSRMASRMLVILSILLVIGASVGGALYLLEVAESTAEAQQTPGDSTDESVIPDSIETDTLGGPLPDPGDPDTSGRAVQ